MRSAYLDVPRGHQYQIPEAHRSRDFREPPQPNRLSTGASVTLVVAGLTVCSFAYMTAIVANADLIDYLFTKLVSLDWKILTCISIGSGILGFRLLSAAIDP